MSIFFSCSFSSLSFFSSLRCNRSSRVALFVWLTCCNCCASSSSFWLLLCIMLLSSIGLISFSLFLPYLWFSLLLHLWIAFGLNSNDFFFLNSLAFARSHLFSLALPLQHFGNVILYYFSYLLVCLLSLSFFSFTSF